MVDNFRASADEDSIIQVRIIEIIIRICRQTCFHRCIETGALSLVEELLVNDDALVQMNVIEVIKMLAQPHGANICTETMYATNYFEYSESLLTAIMSMAQLAKRR